MRAILLAAGEGKRLRPVTESTPKCIVPIGEARLLGIWLSLLERHGVSKVLINLHHLPERVLEYLASFRTRLSVLTVHEPRLLGSAGTVLANRDFVRGEDEFFIAYADNLTNVDIGAMVRYHRGRDATMTVGMVQTNRPREKGILEVDDEGRIVGFEEKPTNPRSNLSNAGLYVADQSLFSYMPPRVPHDGVLDFGFHVMPRMIGKMHGYWIRDFLVDIGTPESYSYAQQTWPGL